MFVSTLTNPESCFLTFVFCAFFFSFFFFTVVQKKAALEKESKLSILEAGVADVSTSFFLPSPSIFILKTGTLGLLSRRRGTCTWKPVGSIGRVLHAAVVRAVWGSVLWLMWFFWLCENKLSAGFRRPHPGGDPESC